MSTVLLGKGHFFRDREGGFGGHTPFPIGSPAFGLRVSPDKPEQDASDSNIDTSGRTEAKTQERVVERVSNESFNAWYDERQVAQNILQGKSYFNGPSPAKDPDHHTPSKLLQCHRKASYSRQNAPREGSPPQGLFWFGSEFEEQIIVPYLQSISSDESYVQNSIWIDTTISTGDTDVHLRGSTDPAIVSMSLLPSIQGMALGGSSTEPYDNPPINQQRPGNCPLLVFF